MNKNESKYFNTSLKRKDALISLLRKKDFEYITVKDVCEEAKVNRSTFYLHYDNTFELLEEVIERLNSSFSNHLNFNKTYKTIVQSSNLDDLFLIKDEFLIPYLTFVKENKKIYRAIKNQPSIFGANKIYKDMFDSLFSPIMSRFGLDSKWHNYMMDFYINGITSVIFDWLINDCDIDINELSNFIQGLVISPYAKKDN